MVGYIFLINLYVVTFSGNASFKKFMIKIISQMFLFSFTFLQEVFAAMCRIYGDRDISRKAKSYDKTQSKDDKKKIIISVRFKKFLYFITQP